MCNALLQVFKQVYNKYICFVLTFSLVFVVGLFVFVFVFVCVCVCVCVLVRLNMCIVQRN